jgi:hypothetical protein
MGVAYVLAEGHKRLSLENQLEYAATSQYNPRHYKAR